MAQQQTAKVMAKILKDVAQQQKDAKEREKLRKAKKALRNQRALRREAKRNPGLSLREYAKLIRAAKGSGKHGRPFTKTPLKTAAVQAKARKRAKMARASRKINRRQR